MASSKRARNSGAMSRNRIPGFGKSGTSTTASRMVLRGAVGHGDASAMPPFVLSMNAATFACRAFRSGSCAYTMCPEV